MGRRPSLTWRGKREQELKRKKQVMLSLRESDVIPEPTDASSVPGK